MKIFKSLFEAKAPNVYRVRMGSRRVRNNPAEAVVSLHELAGRLPPVSEEGLSGIRTSELKYAKYEDDPFSTPLDEEEKVPNE